MSHTEKLKALLARVPVIPVLTFESAEEAVAIGGALIAGGLTTLEVTLRTAAGIEAIAALAKAFPDAEIGAGTVLDMAQAEAARNAGARFLVSPGASEKLLRESEGFSVPWLYGSASASDIMRLRDYGHRVLKFFPAEVAGGAPALKGFAPVFGDVLFCPTGGIDLAKAKTYLALPNVGAVGGSWVVPADAVKARDLAKITALAKEAAALRG